ncbi:unnamed protein product [Timema podura]|uniref:Uncharacterized protein n=1 Tax=Timema podura TaxID=61482 RepID=A0ABN7PJV4_TIMPD|nr:unnamed protein product [Timema podura]
MAGYCEMYLSTGASTVDRYRCSATVHLGT